MVDLKNNVRPDITSKDICNIASFIDLKLATKIIKQALGVVNICAINAQVKEVIAMGYPVDNILTQLNKALLKYPKLSDQQKAQIFKYTASIFYKIKECGNEYIQLLDYLSCVNGVARGLEVYVV
jgi:replication factor C subunit 2/4